MKLAKKPTEFREITQNKGHYAVQGHFKVTDFCTNRKPIYDFLLVINSNLPHLAPFLRIHSLFAPGPIRSTERIGQ